MWFSALKLLSAAATHIYKKKQEDKNGNGGCSTHACSKMAKGEKRIPG